MDKSYIKDLQNYDEHCKRIAKSTTVDINETLADKIKRMNYLEDNYGEWFEYYFPKYAKAKCASFHIDLAESLVDNDEIYILNEVYRSGAKSVHADMGVPMFLMVKGLMMFMLLIGETEPKAKKLISGIQAQLKFNQRFINDYGHQFKMGDWSSGDFITKKGVRFMSLGFGQSPRGVREEERRPDYISVDDVDNKKHVKNDSLMQEGVDYIQEEVIGTFDEMDGTSKRFVFSNNNFHKNSITNRLEQLFKGMISKAKENGIKSDYKIIKVKAVKDLNTFEPTWPEKTSAEYWRKKYANSTRRSFMREYMHVHIQSGTIFKLEDMQWKQALPLRDYEALVFYGDLSFKDNACHKGMVLLGKYKREIHVIHVFLRQTSRVKLAKWLYDLYETRELSRERRIRYYIEGLFSMDEFVNDFDTEGDDRGYYIPVIADKRPKGDKHERIEATQSWFERRNVFFNAEERQNADQIELTDQFLEFEKGAGIAVDGPDAFEGALSKLNFTSRKARGTYKHQPRESRRF